MPTGALQIPAEANGLAVAVADSALAREPYWQPLDASRRLTEPMTVRVKVTVFGKVDGRLN